MSEASVVASTLDSTLQRAARTRESYEQEIAALSAELMSLRTAVDFLQTAIASHGAYEREEAERISAHKQMLKEQKEREEKEEAERLAKEKEEEERERQRQKEIKRAEREHLKALKREQELAELRDKERIEREAREQQELEAKLLYISSEERLMDESMELLKSLKVKKIKKPTK